MNESKFPIKKDSALHRMLKMIAEEVAKEFSVTSAGAATSDKSNKACAQDKAQVAKPHLRRSSAPYASLA